VKKLETRFAAPAGQKEGPPMDPEIKKKMDIVTLAMKDPHADVGKMAEEMMDLANENKKKASDQEQAKAETEVLKKQAGLKHIEAELKAQRQNMEEAEASVMKRKEEMEEDRIKEKDDSQQRAAGAMLTQKSITRKAEARLQGARNDLAHSKEKRHKDSGQLQEYTEQRTAKQKEMTSLRTAGDETGANRLQSDLNVLARLEKGQRDNVANDEVEVKTMMDKLKVAEEESANNARQNTLQSTKLLSELQKAKDAAQGSVSKAMQDESKQAQIITQNSPPL
jgi:hypothetical protein